MKSVIVWTVAIVAVGMLVMGSVQADDNKLVVDAPHGRTDRQGFAGFYMRPILK